MSALLCRQTRRLALAFHTLRGQNLFLQLHRGDSFPIWRQKGARTLAGARVGMVPCELCESQRETQNAAITREDSEGIRRRSEEKKKRLCLLLLLLLYSCKNCCNRCESDTNDLSPPSPSAPMQRCRAEEAALTTDYQMSTREILAKQKLFTSPPFVFP